MSSDIVECPSPRGVQNRPQLRTTTLIKGKKNHLLDISTPLKREGRGTWVAQWLSICLWLRSWPQGPGIESCASGFPPGSLRESDFPSAYVSTLSVCVSHELNKNLKTNKTYDWVTRVLHWAPVTRAKYISPLFFFWRVHHSLKSKFLRWKTQL